MTETDLAGQFSVKLCPSALDRLGLMMRGFTYKCVHTVDSY